MIALIIKDSCSGINRSHLKDCLIYFTKLEDRGKSDKKRKKSFLFLKME